MIIENIVKVKGFCCSYDELLEYIDDLKEKKAITYSYSISAHPLGIYEFEVEYIPFKDDKTYFHTKHKKES